jgi:hypothetical protein
VDLNALLASGNWWAIAVGIGLTLASQWAKSRIAPSPTPGPNQPGPVPAPAPNGTPILDALLELLKKRMLAGSGGFETMSPMSYGSAPPTTGDIDQAAATKLLSLMQSPSAK